MTKTFPKQSSWMRVLLRFMLILGIMMTAFPGLTATVFAQSLTDPALPQVLLDTTYSPPTGRIIPVANGGDFQAALDTAQPGDLIELEAGATFTGNFTLPNKSGTGWIYIQSSAYSSLPAPGTRVSPLQASLMAKIVSPNASPSITSDFGAHQYRFIGIEITTTWASTTATFYNLISLGTDLLGNPATSLSQLPHDITFDRCYIHGTPTGNVRRGIALNSAYTAVIDSYLSNFHEIGADSQAIGGWNGPGPFKLVNNYLEGAGENLLFGGADPSILNLVPSDIEIRRNSFFKPLSWKVGDPSYAGLHWSVKNILELKNARRVLIEGNLFENNWVDAQNGFSILFTVRNQDGTAPWSVVEDITFTNNILRHAAAGMNLLGTDNLHPSQQTKRILIKNNLFEDIGGSLWGGSGRLFQLLDGTANVDIDHNTAFQTGDIIVASGASNIGFIYRNNITPHNLYGVAGDGTFGNPLLTLTTYFPEAVFVKNVLVGGNSWNYPPENFFPASLNDVGFVDLGGGNYRLASSSPYKNGGTDGKDIGADIDAIDAAINNTAPLPADTTPPTISAVAALSITAGGAIITWNTNEAATSQVEYGTTMAYGNSTAFDITLVTSHTLTLSGLAANTLYHYRVKSQDAAGNLAVSGDFTFMTLAVSDTTPPAISGVAYSNLSSSGSTITWATDEASDSQVEYGQTTAYGSSTALNTNLVTSHAQTLSGLTANTLYHYRVKSRDAAGNLAVSADFTFTTLAAGTRSPYKGVPLAVPGLIEAEDFDNGGEGVAYHDMVPGNAGGLYRLNEDVDIIANGTGYAVNNIQTGEWLSYTINVTQSGTYRIEAAVSSEFTTSRWHVEIDEVDMTGPVLVPNTGNWQTFQFIGKSGVTLTAGVHILKLYAEQEYFNLDALRLVAEGPQPVTWTSLVNVTANGNSLTKTTGCDGCEDAGAVSVQTIPSGDGYLEFTASETTTYRVIGLSNGNTDTSRADIDFAIQFGPNGGTDVRENGVYRNAETSYVTGDVFRITVQSGIVRYYKNGTLLYTSMVVPTDPLLVDTSVWSLNGTITNAVIATGSSVSNADTSPPTVSITAPISGSTVTGTITISANASDNVGVAGTQFKLDDTNIGAEVTATPYSISWDTTTAANGAHTLTAVARDAAGNSTLSSAIAVTVSNDTTPPVISAVVSSNISSSGATITWTTNETSDSQVEYGPTTAYGSSTALNTSMFTSHSQTLSGLAVNTLYHYRVKSRDAAGNLAVSADFTFTTLAAQSPYKGVPFAVPGLIGAEDFDNGGEGVAYHDLTSGNQGGLYRTNVDVDIISPFTGVYVVNNFQTGEWLEYTINVAQSGTYQVEARVSSEFTTSRWHIELDGVNKTGSIFVPKTGSWRTFKWVGKSGVPLTAGPHILRIYVEQEYFNLDAIRLVAEGPQPVTWTSLVNVTANGNSLQKTSGCDGCQDAGAISQQQISSGNGYVEFTASETTTYRVIGLSNGNTDTSRADIDFAIQFGPNGGSDVRENGVYRNAETSYVTGDVFRIAVESGQVKYYKNGALFYTSTKVPTYPLLVDTSIWNLNATITNAVIAGQ